MCRPSSLLSKNAEVAGKVDDRVCSTDGPVDLMDAERQAERDVVSERESALAMELREMRDRKSRLVDPLQFAVSLEDEDLLNFVPTFAWEMEPPSEKQLSFIENSGIAVSSVMNKGHAHMIIDRIRRRRDLGLATPKQIRLLERYGFAHVGTWRASEATEIIGRLSSNGWRLPYGFNARGYVPGVHA